MPDRRLIAKAEPRTHTKRAGRQARAIEPKAVAPLRPLIAAAPALPRKASAADFLADGPIAPAEGLVGAADMSDDANSTVALPPASEPVGVVSAVRRTAARPQLPTIQEEATTPVILTALYTRRGRLIMPAAMKGTRAILVHQNEMADREGLDRVEDDEDLSRMRVAHRLVAIPVSGGMVVDERLPANRRYVCPWTAKFLKAMGQAHYARFHSSLQVNSAVRTVEFQQRLIRVNGNAAPAEGSTASPHLTGQAVDMAKHGLSQSEIAWMRAYLTTLVGEGKIDVEEEFQQACFHISVYKSYAPERPVQRGVGRTRQGVLLAAVALRH